jgi:hypothetical protein
MNDSNDDLLAKVKVASPCRQSWAGMTGDDQVRHCGACRMNVYNLSAMRRDEALKLVREREGRVCVRLYRRADGTMLTADCPVGLRAVRRQLGMALTGAVALLVTGVAFASGIGERGAAGTEPPPSSLPMRYQLAKEKVRSLEPIKTIVDKIDPPVLDVEMGDMVMDVEDREPEP